MNLIMKSFDKNYIIEKLGQLKTLLENYIKNREIDLDACRELFTNDFAYFAFQKCLEQINESFNASEIYEVTIATTNNVFLVVSNWIFGVNDDGKIFAVCSNTKPQTLMAVYSLFDYDCDILDNKICNKIKFDGNAICWKVSKTHMKVYDTKWIRICGDLKMRFDNSDLVVYQFKDLLTLYIYELWMQRLAEYGIIVHTLGTPYVVYTDKQTPQLTELLLNELINVLKSVNCEVISYETRHDPFDTIIMVCRFANILLNVSFKYDLVMSGYSFVINIDKRAVNRLMFVKSVLNTIGIDENEQNIIINFGNHKIILRGYYFPLLTLGTTFISIDRFLATEILMQHPEHHDVQIIFKDLVGIEFDTIQLPQPHQMLRNEYFANKIKF